MSVPIVPIDQWSTKNVKKKLILNELFIKTPRCYEILILVMRWRRLVFIFYLFSLFTSLSHYNLVLLLFILVQQSRVLFIFC